MRIFNSCQTDRMRRPLLLLDVDGVLAVKRPTDQAFQRHSITSSVGHVHEVWLNPSHGAALSAVADIYDVVWATGWETDAPRALAPLLSIPDFPVIEFAQRPRLGTRLDKLPDIKRLAADRPTAWVDDDPGADGRRWAQTREIATLLIEPTSTSGLQPSHVNDLLAFAVRVDPANERERPPSEDSFD